MRPAARLSLPLVAPFAVLALAACGDKTPTPAAPAAAQGEVLRDTSGDRPAPAPAAAPAAVIQTQAGPKGAQVDLTRVAVTGDVLTVQLSYRAPLDRSFSDVFDIDDISVIDDAMAQRYGVLKSADGQPLASPLLMTSRINASAGRGEAAVVWLKFPAPPATSPTVSINIPNVGPFDGVPVTR